LQFENQVIVKNGNMPYVMGKDWELPGRRGGSGFAGAFLFFGHTFPFIPESRE